jgi:outer membrane protein assembly complex protein YaeT
MNVLKQIIGMITCSTCLVLHAAEVNLSGLKSMSRGQAREILGDRLELIKKKPATPARASDAAFMLERLMRLQGFANASVTGTVESGNAIRLTVHEGSRQYLGTISIDGVETKELKHMRRLFSSPAEKRMLAFAQQVPFLEEDVTMGMSYLTQELQSRGYWNAKAELLSRSKPAANGKVDFEIRIEQGPLHTLESPRISGNLPHYRKTLQRKLLKLQGVPATTANINQVRSVTEALYRKHGYPDAQIRVSGEPVNGKFLPELSVQLGERYRLSEVTVTGLEKTKASRVLMRFDGMEGKYYDATRMDREVRKLLNTGAFQSMRLETSVDESGQVLDATLQAAEGKARSYRAYTGLETYEGPIFGVGYSDRNFLGNLWNLSGGLEMSARGMLFDARVVEPWLFDHDVKAGARFFAVNRDLDVYQKFESGFSVDFTWEITEFDTLLLFAASSYVNITDSLIAPADLGATEYSHNRVRLTWTHDERNNKVSPSDGWITDVAGEMGTVIGTENSSYLKWEMRGSWYVPVKETNHVALGLRSGMLIPATAADVPIDLRYFLGGASTVRSFPERELGPRNRDDVTRGGEAYWIANAEYVHQITGPIKAVAFSDIGTLSEDSATFGFSTFDIAVGVGIRADLPIGPVRLEYGHNMTRDNGEPNGAFHFAIGVSF